MASRLGRHQWFALHMVRHECHGAWWHGCGVTFGPRGRAERLMRSLERRGYLYSVAAVRTGLAAGFYGREYTKWIATPAVMPDRPRSGK